MVISGIGGVYRDRGRDRTRCAPPARRAGPVTSADYSNTMRRRHRFVLVSVSVLLPLLLVVPAVRTAVGSKNQGAPSVKGNRYTRFCNSCSPGPRRSGVVQSLSIWSAHFRSESGSLDAKCFWRRVGNSSRNRRDVYCFRGNEVTNKKFLYLIVSPKIPNYYKHLLTWCICGRSPLTRADLNVNLLFFSFLFYSQTVQRSVGPFLDGFEVFTTIENIVFDVQKLSWPGNMQLYYSRPS